MSMSTGPTDALALPAAASTPQAKPSTIECELVALFDQFRDPTLRYVLSFGISTNDGEEVTQEVFLALFRHLRMGRPRGNLRGWIFRVAHNLALKRRSALRRAREIIEPLSDVAEKQPDRSPNPEDQLSFSRRHERLLAVFRALPQEDQNCLRLRAEGLRYREITEILNVSLGTVSMSLTRSLARLIRADRM